MNVSVTLFVFQVCVYDRAGLGWSEPAPRLNMSDPGEAAVARTLGPEATGVRMVSDLHRLITFAHPQEKPLVLPAAATSMTTNTMIRMTITLWESGSRTVWMKS